MGEENRRSAPRIPAKVPVKLRPVEGATPFMVSADSINISERGLYFQMIGPMKPGTRIELSFTMPSEVTGSVAMKIRCIGRVIRVEPDGKADGRTAVAAQIERFETIVAEA
ncbi:MAG: PilZ domain-containing protein [Acidobacteria bacterium]|nr:PilZ domain-containing protein [Acidobacteriota bacterium]